MRFLHCSDIHVTQDYASAPFLKLGWRRWLAMLEVTVGGRGNAYRDAKQTLRQIASEVGLHAAEALLISGDLTGYATIGEFEEAREALGRVADSSATCAVIPGNHDCFTPNAERTQRFERYFGHLLGSDLPEYQREGPYPFVHLKGDEAAVVGLRSARVQLPGLASGTIGEAQLAGLAALLADPRMSGRAVLVMVHHGPLDARGRPDSAMHGLTDGAALLTLLPGPRFAVLHGHIHERYHHVATAARPHMFCAGSSTQRGHEGYWVIDVAGGVITKGAIHTPRPFPSG